MVDTVLMTTLKQHCYELNKANFQVKKIIEFSKSFILLDATYFNKSALLGTIIF